jgi:hypothetical protein
MFQRSMISSAHQTLLPLAALQLQTEISLIQRAIRHYVFNGEHFAGKEIPQ